MSDKSFIDELKQATKAAWWIILIQGIIMLILGLMLLGHPDKTLVVLITLLGIFWLINGILDIVAGITGRTGNSKAWVIFGGIIMALAGLVVLNQPLLAGKITTAFLASIIAIAIIANGFFQIFAGRVTGISDAGLAREWSFSSLLIGILYIIGGVLLLTHPAWAVVTFLTLVSIWALLAGIAQIVASFRVRSVIQEITT